MDFKLRLFPLLWGVFRRGLWALVLHPGPCLQSENRQAQSKPDPSSSVLFSTSLITTCLPFGPGSSSPFPRVAWPPPGCRKEAIDGMFLRMTRGGGKPAKGALLAPVCSPAPHVLPWSREMPAQTSSQSWELSSVSVRGPKAKHTVGSLQMPNQDVPHTQYNPISTCF